MGFMSEKLFSVTPEDLLSLISSRQSERSYTSEPVEEEALRRILEAGRLAPSACNAQPWHFIVVRDEALRMEVADATASRTLGLNHFTKQAPVQIVVVQESANFTSKVGTMVKGTSFPLIDVGLAVGQMCLQAQAEGLGTCIIGWLDQKRIRKALSIPSSKRVPVLVLLGHPNSPLREKRRKSFEEVVSFDEY